MLQVIIKTPSTNLITTLSVYTHAYLGIVICMKFITAGIFFQEMKVYRSSSIVISSNYFYGN